MRLGTLVLWTSIHIACLSLAFPFVSNRHAADISSSNVKRNITTEHGNSFAIHQDGLEGDVHRDGVVNTTLGTVDAVLATGATKPAATDKQWDDAVCQGGKLLAAMLASDKDAAQYINGATDTAESTFTDYKLGEFTKWGYLGDSEEAKLAWDAYSYPEISTAMKSFGISWDKDDTESEGQVIKSKLTYDAKDHLQETTQDNVKYPATRARFWTTMNVEQGVLAGWHKYGPKFTVVNWAKLPSDTALPKLKNWGDVAFLQWKSEYEKKKMGVSNLRFIVSGHVQNDDSMAILGRAMGLKDEDKSKPRQPPVLRAFRDDRRSGDCVDWDKKITFDTTTDAGKAILAAPNGRGAAFLLIQHKSTFGEKTYISKVDIYCEISQLNWIFTVSKG